MTTLLEQLLRAVEQDPKLNNRIIGKYNIKSNSEPSFKDNVCPGFILDLIIGDDLVHGIVLNDKTLLLIDSKTHSVKGYLRNYTDKIPYNVLRIRKPINDHYKYSDETMPVVWEVETPKTEMTIEEIEKALGLKIGSLIVK